MTAVVAAQGGVGSKLELVPELDRRHEAEQSSVQSADLSRTGAGFLLLEGTDEAEVRKARRYDFWGRVGLCLLIGGFVAQGVGSSTVFW